MTDVPGGFFFYNTDDEETPSDASGWRTRNLGGRRNVFDGNLYQIQDTYTQIQNQRQGGESWAVCTALKLYRQARYRCLWAKAWAALTGRSRALMDLNAIRASCILRASHYVGIQTIALDRIQGSEGRCHDFDVGFRPLQSHNRERWLRIAAAQLMRMPLPPVALVRVGDRYFVLDGHHRISVARAMGQTEIDAEVTVCEFAGPLPWEQAAVVRKMAPQLA
jgi:hypothetical protein